MPSLPTNAIIQVSFNYDHHLQHLMNITHWEVVAAVPGDEFDQLQEIADYFSDTAVAGRPAKAIVEGMPSSCTLTHVRAQMIQPSRRAYRESPVFEPGTRDPSNTANLDAVLTKQCGDTGRDQRGNFYLPGLAPDDYADGKLSGGFRTYLEVNFVWLKQTQVMPVSGIELRPVIFHKDTGFASQTLSFVVQEQARVMCRRTVGRGI